METLLEKQPQRPGPKLLPQVEDQNGPVDSIPKLSPRQAASVITAADHQLRRLKKHQQNLKSAPITLGAGNEKAQLLSNKTHYSPTDPDARISIKLAAADRRVKPANSITIVAWQWIRPKGLSAMYRLILPMAGTASLYLILRGSFSSAGPPVRLVHNELRLEEILADTGYSNGGNYALLEGWKITGWIPVFGKYKPQIDGFPYDPVADQFTCSAGKPLPFKNFDSQADGGLLKIYRAAYQDCQQCPLKPTCIPNSKCRQITRTAYGPFYRRAWDRQQSRRGKRMKRLRQQTVEPV